MPRNSDAELNEVIGKDILRLRKRNGLVQEDLVPLIGISNSQISKYERGVDQISVRTLWILAKALNAEPGDFYYGFEPDIGRFSEAGQAAYGLLDPEDVHRELAKLLPTMDEATAMRILKIARVLIADELERRSKR